MKLNKHVKALWVEALRSGKYKQGRNSLRPSQNKFCCLGVLADQICPLEWKGRDWQGHGVLLPPELAAEINLSYKAETTLADLNDDYGKSFNEIADYIEKKL